MIEYKQCTNCYGNKTIVGIGFQKKECYVCNGAGRIVDNAATEVGNISQSTLTQASINLANDNERLETDLKNVSESHLILNAENEELKAKQAQHDEQLAQAERLQAELQEQYEIALKEANARAEIAEQALAEAKNEIKKLKAKGGKPR